jgi:DNA-binding transcriptional LysR family regulator
MIRPTRAMLRGLRFEELLEDPLRLAMSPRHPLAARRIVPFAEAAREPLVTYSRKDYPEYHEFLGEMFVAIKMKPRVAEEHDSVSSLIAAVEAGCGVALVSQSLVCFSGERLKLASLSPKPPPFVVGAAWAEPGPSAAAERFLKCAREAAQAPIK